MEGSTFQLYLTNLRQFLQNMVKISHQVIFNRMPEEELEPYGNLFRVMICCAADIQFLSVQCHCPEESVPEDQAWILLTATGTLRTDHYGQKCFC